jgi:predicted transposase YdaD
MMLTADLQEALQTSKMVLSKSRQKITQEERQQLINQMNMISLNLNKNIEAHIQNNAVEH